MGSQLLGGVATAAAVGGMSAGPALALRPAVFAAVEGLSLLVGLLLQALMMRALGPAGYGGYALACALGLVAMTVTDFGFNFSGVTRAIEVAHDPDAAHRHFWAVQSTKAFAAIATGVIAWGWALWAGDAQARMIAWAMTVGALAAWCLPSWFLFSRQKVILLACGLLASRVLCLIAMLLIVEGAAQIGSAIFLTLGAPLIAAPMMLSSPAVRAQMRPRWPGAVALGVATRSGLSTLWLSAQVVVSAAVLQSLLFSLTSSTPLGVFAAADRVRGGVQGLFAAFGVAAFPRLVQLGVDRNVIGQDRAWPLLRLQLLVAVAAALLVFFLAPWIVSVVLGAQFQASVPVLRVLALALISSTFFTAIGVQVMLPRSMARQYTFATLALLALQSAALVVLAPAAGAVGAAWAVVLSESIVAASVFMLVVRRKPP